MSSDDKFGTQHSEDLDSKATLPGPVGPLQNKKPETDEGRSSKTASGQLEQQSARNVGVTSSKDLAADTPIHSEGEDSAPSKSAPRTLGQYRILEKIAEGGMGEVYRARHVRLGKVVALKVLSHSRMDDASAVQRFEREMLAVGCLNHPNIVASSDAGEIDGRYYLVMEMVNGIDLDSVSNLVGRISSGAACEIVRQAAIGLQHAHDHSFVHRDIKPSNLMMTFPSNPDETPLIKVLDLGLALQRMRDSLNNSDLTSHGDVMGTLEFMAPEQGVDARSVDARADIYSLGVTLYLLLSGTVPFPQKHYSSHINLLISKSTQPPPRLSSICPDIDPHLDVIVNRMIATKREDRILSAREVAESLEQFANPSELRSLVHHFQRLQSQNRSSPIVREPSDTPPTVHPSVGLPAPYRSGGDSILSDSEKKTSIRIYGLAAAILGLVLLAATYLIRVQSSKGELVIESEVDGISVKVLSDGEKVIDGWSLQKGADNKQRIRTGQIEIELPADLTADYTITPNLITLNKGRVVVARIERRDKQMDRRDFKPVPKEPDHATTMTPEKRRSAQNLVFPFYESTPVEEWARVLAAAKSNPETRFWVILRSLTIQSNDVDPKLNPYLEAQYRNGTSRPNSQPDEYSNFRVLGYVSAWGPKDDETIWKEIEYYVEQTQPSVTGLFIDNVLIYSSLQRQALFRRIRDRYGKGFSLFVAVGSPWEDLPSDGRGDPDVIFVHKGPTMDYKGIEFRRQKIAQSNNAIELGAIQLSVDSVSLPRCLDSFSEHGIKYFCISDFTPSNEEDQWYDKPIGLPSYWEQLFGEVAARNKELEGKD